MLCAEKIVESVLSGRKRERVKLGSVQGVPGWSHREKRYLKTTTYSQRTAGRPPGPPTSYSSTSIARGV
ncbi:hypothetical protein QC762_0116620 [Podospora pseudocomata]|uniref:Uncharacterized protein n=1 Tax=Podospora pseudocomata TaxID=2093779 RepID=A0ABR0G627_9PEZI|nr:hypothetical protein QC762_0116620 [Podospora pseudocomata]